LFDEAWIEATPPDRKRLIPTRREGRMSRTRKIKMTRKRIAAHKAKGKPSHGPATPEGMVKDMAEIALALFCQLHPPGNQDGSVSSLDEFEKARLMVAQAKETFGIGMGEYVPPSTPRRVSAGRRKAGKMPALHPKARKMPALHPKAAKTPALPGWT